MELERKRKHVDELFDKIREIKYSKEKMERSLNERVNALTRQLESLEYCREGNESLKQEIQNLVDKGDERRSKYECLLKEKESVIDNLERTIENKDDVIIALEENIEKLSKYKKNQMNKKRAETKKRNASHTKEIDDLKDAIVSKDKEIEDLTLEVKELQKMVEAAQREIKRLKSDHTKEKMEEDKRKKKLIHPEELDLIVKEHKKELKDKTKEMRKMRKEMNKKIRDLEKQLRKSQKPVKKNIGVKSFESQIEQLNFQHEIQVKKLNKEILEIESAHNNNINLLRQENELEVESLKKKIKELEKKNTLLKKDMKKIKPKEDRIAYEDSIFDLDTSEIHDISEKTKGIPGYLLSEIKEINNGDKRMDVEYEAPKEHDRLVICSNCSRKIIDKNEMVQCRHCYDDFHLGCMDSKAQNEKGEFECRDCRKLNIRTGKKTKRF